MGLRGVNAKPVNRKANGRKRPATAPEPEWNDPGLSRAGRVLAWIEHLRLSTGEHAGKRFMLRDWQRNQILRPLYEVGPDGLRVKRQAVISLPRKNGKTQLGAAILLCHLAGPEAEPRGQVVSAAVSRDQATLLMRERWRSSAPTRSCRIESSFASIPGRWRTRSPDRRSRRYPRMPRPCTACNAPAPSWTRWGSGQCRRGASCTPRSRRRGALGASRCS
jgi:hypothetical protein